MSGFCGIIAELSLFNLANTLLGSTNIVLTYTMGVMLFFMGVGALAVRFTPFKKSLLESYVLIEMGLSLLVSSSVFIIYWLSALYPAQSLTWVLMYSSGIGFLIGFEIPLILLINQKLKQPLAESSAYVLFADYLGSLLAFILFSHLLLSQLGIANTALFGAALNGCIAFITLLSFRRQLKFRQVFLLLSLCIGIIISLGLYHSEGIMNYVEQLHYRDKVIWKKQTPYQKVVVTWEGKKGYKKYDSNHRERPKSTLFSKQISDSSFLSLIQYRDKKDLRLFINGGLQFSTFDEAYYHEMLVHPALYLKIEEQKKSSLKVLIGGGGDGMALREVLKHPEVKEVSVVDLDPEITRLFTQNPLFSALNDSSYWDKRVKVYNADFMHFLKTNIELYDLIILDFPDPHHYEVSKLYSQQFYQLTRKRLDSTGLLVTQATSPYFSQKAFLVIHKTLKKIFPDKVLPYKVPMPTFGLWGFHMASKSLSRDSLFHKLEGFKTLVPCQYINQQAVQSATRWDKKTFQLESQVKVHSLLKPSLTRAYHSSPRQE